MRISDWSSDVCSGTLPNRRILLMSCRPLALFFLAATALLSACGDGKDGNNEQAVAMRDMEVVAGTATDAMTDPDGVQTEGNALPPARPEARRLGTECVRTSRSRRSALN